MDQSQLDLGPVAPTLLWL